MSGADIFTLFMLGAMGTGGWVVAAVVTWKDHGERRRGARMTLLTPVWPIIACALAGIYLVKSVNALFVAAEIGQHADGTVDHPDDQQEWKL